MSRFVLLVALLAPSTVIAAPAEHNANETDGAPIPGDESGRIDEDTDGDSALRTFGRGALFVPKIALEVAFAPVRGGVWAYERYQLGRRVHDVFFTDDGMIGLYPTLAIESGFGATFGASFVHRDLYGEGEHLALHAGSGGRFRQIYNAKLHSGNRFGSRLRLEVAGSYELRPKDAFYGIGNDDASDMDVDPAVEARFRKTRARGAAVVDVRVAGDLHVRGSEALTDLAFEDSDVGPPIDSLYMPSSLVGFGGVRTAYSELEVRWDDRRAGSNWDPRSMRGTGWLVSGFAGRSQALDENHDYWRYGGELQRFVRLSHGPRVISARLYGEAVSGASGDVPFDELPMLGGKFLLRGYALDRFRDRVAALGSVEYTWGISRLLSASAFSDAGRVFSSVRDVNVDHLRVGYGIAIAAHTDRSHLMRLSLASSIDGGVFIDFAFDPAFDVDTRLERR